MKTTITIFISLLFLIQACAVKKIMNETIINSPETSEPIFVVVEDMPSFQGGDINSFKEWVQERVVYPKSLLRMKVEGKVFVMFIVEPDGTVSDVNIMRGLHPKLDEETIRVVKSSPPWKPGLQRGAAVRVRFSITTEYTLID
ncbi:MAG: energy transducer TonB [Bacteroidales bacterium]|nr:energy transducer TonB [Bacteroidales bacterium]